MHLREATATDAQFLRDMLVEAVNWSGEQRITRSDVDEDPHLSRYVRDWPRADDFGVVAEADAGEPVGAAWARTLPAHDSGYGFVAADVPELSMAVAPTHRGRGIGRALLSTMVELAQQQGWRAVSLSVEDGNRVADLYRAAGFQPVGRSENSQTMLLELRA